jgi:hypothetical protein
MSVGISTQLEEAISASPPRRIQTRKVCLEDPGQQLSRSGRQHLDKQLQELSHRISGSSLVVPVREANAHRDRLTFEYRSVPV